MKKSTEVAVAVPNTFLTAMTSNVNVGINEVVSVFVAKYETGLFEKKDELSAKIKTVKRELDALTNRIVSAVNKVQYEKVIPEWELKSKVESVKINWGSIDETDDDFDYDDNRSNKKNSLVVTVGIFGTKGEDRSYSVIARTIATKLSKADINENKRLSKDLADLEGELVAIMADIKGVSRKERQIRGKISEMKLEQSGFAELANNSEMLKLIEVK